ncbi:hypothetical protein TrLO_g8630 [Triparma laevis f. longispina]|uniref:LNR domain-containing protein n=1 Tax=Triparma laevis f. longispina TaxID=1714387 RepID=A0A9W7B0L2_9STRA|nr:hypothetical protein TrLO_g8630 [Triparma laevis f. longispina]
MSYTPPGSVCPTWGFTGVPGKWGDGVCHGFLNNAACNFDGGDCIMVPTPSPTDPPTSQPTTAHPTVAPTPNPTNQPTTAHPTVTPTLAPTSAPTTLNPTSTPTLAPTFAPTSPPTTLNPTSSPTTPSPTEADATPPPSAAPTTAPTPTSSTSPTTFAAPTDPAKSTVNSNTVLITAASAGGGASLLAVFGLYFFRRSRNSSNRDGSSSVKRKGGGRDKVQMFEPEMEDEDDMVVDMETGMAVKPRSDHPDLARASNSSSSSEESKTSSSLSLTSELKSSIGFVNAFCGGTDIIIDLTQTYASTPLQSKTKTLPPPPPPPPPPPTLTITPPPTQSSPPPPVKSPPRQKTRDYIEPKVSEGEMSHISAQLQSGQVFVAFKDKHGNEKSGNKNSGNNQINNNSNKNNNSLLGLAGSAARPRGREPTKKNPPPKRFTSTSTSPSVSISRSPSAPDHTATTPMTSINRSLSTGLHTRNALRSVVFVDDDILSTSEMAPHNSNNRVVGILKNGGGRAIVENEEVETVFKIDNSGLVKIDSSSTTKLVDNEPEASPGIMKQLRESWVAMQDDIRGAVLPNATSYSSQSRISDQPKIINAIYYEKDDSSDLISDLTGVGQHSATNSIMNSFRSDNSPPRAVVPKEELYEELYDHEARIEEHKRVMENGGEGKRESNEFLV